MRLTKAMLRLIYQALLKFDTLTEKTEEDEAMTRRCLEWAEARIERQGRKGRG